MHNCIYLDNSSTTKPCGSAVEEINKALLENWGNPSSLHELGVNAESILTETRETISSLIGCRCDEIFFTGGGTEGNNLAIRGAAAALIRRGNKIVTTSVEHPSVFNTCSYLEQNGFEVVYIKPERDGHIDPDKIISAADDKTVLVSMMLVNNETGCIFPVQDVAKTLKRNGCKALIHSDCVQAFGKMNIDTETLGVDLLTASGHKIHGPKGIGFLYKSKKINIKPIVFGGGQEKGLRSGTEAVPLAAGLNGAINELTVDTSLRHIGELHRYAADRLVASCGAVLNSPQNEILPYIINISVPGYRSETLLHFLESKGIFVSSGSACSKGKGSHVLNEMGLERDRIDSALRISFSRFSTENDIDRLCDALTEAKKTLHRK